VWFQNISIPTPRRGNGNSKGEGVGGLKNLCFKRKVNESKLKIVEGGFKTRKKLLCEAYGFPGTQ